MAETGNGIGNLSLFEPGQSVSPWQLKVVQPPGSGPCRFRLSPTKLRVGPGQGGTGFCKI